MKKFMILSLVLSLGLLLSNCDKPDVLKQEATLKIENTSTANFITRVYVGTVVPGVNDKVNSHHLWWWLFKTVNAKSVHNTTNKY